MNSLPDITSLVSRLGGPVAVGKTVGLTHSAVCQWRQIPDKYLVTLELDSIKRGDPVYREEMRPDLFIRGVPSS